MKPRIWSRKANPFGAPAKAPRAKPRKLEDPIHILCFNWLASNIDGIVYHCPNGIDAGSEVIFIKGRAVPRAALAWKKLEKMGARSGVLDLTLHWRAESGLPQTAYLEVKSEEGSLNKGQKDFIGDLDRCGIPHFVIRSLADCLDAVDSLKIPLKKFAPCTRGLNSGNLSD